MHPISIKNNVQIRQNSLEIQPKWTKMVPKWRQKVPKKYQDGAHIFRPISEIVSRALPGTILVDFGRIFNEFWWILALFLIEIGCIFARTFPDHRSRLARNKSTENLKNMQVISEIYTNWTQAKTQTSNIWSISCIQLNASSCTKTV